MKLTLEDVIARCDKCRGTGQLVPPEVTTSDPNATTGKSCDRCGGKGQVLTETGRVIAAVIQHVSLYGR